MTWKPDRIDELFKEATLTPSEEKSQAAQFAGLGAVATPAVSGVTNLIQHGKVVPKGVSPKRWLPAQLVGGAVLGGLLPGARSLIERRNIEKARVRREVESRVREAGQMGVEIPTVKSAASKNMAKHMKLRKDRRPIRVDTLLKKSSKSGSDLRVPIMGGTKPPTDDSKSFAAKSLKSSSAEVGPTPSTKSLSPGGPKIKDLVPTFGTRAGMPKVGATMSVDELIQNDPMVKHLRKVAMELDDNKEDAPRQSEPAPMKSECPDPTMDDKAKGQWSSDLEKLFDAKVKKKKYTGKDHSPKAGTVDKLL